MSGINDTLLIAVSIFLFLGTVALLYVNWKILQITELLLGETRTIRKDTKFIKRDSKRVADSFEIEVLYLKQSLY